MQDEKQTEYIQRDKILKMLSDDEVARVSRAETETALASGEEYLDLKHLEKGVQRASTSLRANNLLPKKAVREATWLQIIASLTPSHA